MKKLVLAILLLASPAVAQQQQLDPTALAYRQLLGEANDRVAAATNQIQMLTKQVEDLKGELAKARPSEQKAQP